jgi:hypothetical protein
MNWLRALIFLVASTASLAAPVPDSHVTITLVRWPFMCSLSDPAELLIRDVAAELGARVEVKIEEYGRSELARRSRIKRFPVVFVDGQLLARPEDFGFDDGADGQRGKYVPWRDTANQRRFRDDLKAVALKRLGGSVIAHP